MSRAPICSCDTKNWEYISISFLFTRFTTKSILRTSVFRLCNHLLESKIPNLSDTWGNVSKWLQNIPFLESPRLWSGQPSPETPWPAKWKNSQKERLIESVAQDSDQSPSCMPHSLQDLSLALPTASPIFKTGIINLFFLSPLIPSIWFVNFPGQRLVFIWVYSTTYSKVLTLAKTPRHDWNTKKWQYLDQTWRTQINNRKAAWYFFSCSLCFSVTCLFISKPQQTSNQAVKSQICGQSST